MSSSQRAFAVTRAQALWSAGLEALEQRKQEINDLNVYPVPDGDTGTNMVLTVRSIVDGVSRLPTTSSQAEVCSAVSQSALMGARGNSGVILSQMIRGAMEILGHAEPPSVQVFIAALRHATDTAYRAVRRPVEGTMLTVLRDMAEAAAKAGPSLDPETFLRQVVAAGWESVARTPKLLKVLAEAGVVDAGGFGLVVLLEGVVDGRASTETPIALRWTPQPEMETGVYAEQADYEEESRFTYCTSFLLSGSGLVPNALEEKLSCLGNSLLVVGDHQRIKVHVHTDSPGEVLNIATSLGVLTEIEIDNMKEQEEARKARLAGQEASGPEAGQTVFQVSAQGGALSEVVAVVAGEGNKALFRSLGVDLIVEGGQSMNPSTEDLLKAIQQVKAPAVILLPNNGNVIMTAEQTVGLAGREVHVVPTRSIQAGLSAAVAFDKRRPAEANVKDMWAAAQALTTAEVTRAVRDSLVDGVQIRAGQYMGLVDEQVVTASDDLVTVVELVVDRLLAEGREMLTGLLGEGQEAAEVGRVLESLRERYPEVEIELHSGGQPFYPVLLSAE